MSGSHVVAGLPQLVAGPLDLGSGELWRTVAVVVVAGAASFLWGGINPATLIGRTLGRDVTRAGSGNPGATNAGRVLGRKWGILVGVLDVAKGFVPAFLGAAFGSVYAVALLAVFVLVFAVSRWVALGSLLAAALMLVGGLLAAFGRLPGAIGLPTMIWAWVLGLVIVLRHRDNVISRLRSLGRLE